MKVLVTGATGFIGSRLCLELNRRPHSVVATGRRSRPEIFNNTTIEYVSSSLEDSQELQPLLEGVEAIIHCAGKTGVWGHYEDYFEANVTLTKRLMDVAKRTGVKRFIHLSSPSLYFQFKDQENLKEDEIPKKFSNAYAQTKFLSEKEVLKECSPDFRTLCLRPRGVIGAGDTNWLPRIIELYQSGKLIIPGNGNNRVDFTSCKNLVSLMIDCLEFPEEVFGDTYNITNGEPQKLWDFAISALEELSLFRKGQALKKLPLALLMGLAFLTIGFAKILRFKDEPKLHPLKVGVAAYSMTLNIDKARQKLNYRPEQSTKEALKEFVAWWQESHS